MNNDKLWKIERDPYYGEMYKRGDGEDYIKSAGFFYDNAKEDYRIEDSLDIMCTPLNFLMKDWNTSDKRCVLLTTGSFSPVHSGHIEMMTATKEKMESNGWKVLGGYFAPDHDEYINWKLREEAIPFHFRMKQIVNMTKDMDWLTVDPWAGIFQPVAINFTDIIRRLEMYIERHTGVKIPVVFVCGQDNARFVKTFEYNGMCAIAERNDTPMDNFLSDVVDDHRIFYVPKKDNSSSTDVRKLLKWKHQKRDVMVRIDDRIGGKDTTWLSSDSRDFALVHMIEQRFASMEVSSVSEQSENARQLNAKSIYIDQMVDGKHQFLVSRRYDFFGIKQLGYTNNPGAKPLENQYMELPREGSWFLLDDDIHTGGTMKFVKNFIESRGEMKIAGNISFNTSKGSEEIIDTRDFMYAHPDGGLVVKQIDGSEIRVPYLYPFVCPFMRASIPDPMQFSIDVWELNMSYFAAKKDKMCYDDCKRFRDLLLPFRS